MNETGLQMARDAVARISELALEIDRLEIRHALRGLAAAADELLWLIEEPGDPTDLAYASRAREQITLARRRVDEVIVLARNELRSV